MGHWTGLLTKKEKTHLKEFVMPLQGLVCSKDIAIEQLKKSRDCRECDLIMHKLTDK